MDWCPGPNPDTVQYLAVSTLKDLHDNPELGTRRSRESRSSIQIWSLDTSRGKKGCRDTAGSGSALKCEMVLCIQGGAAMELKWMPIGARDSVRFQRV
jgi:transcription factor C subunit 6